MSPLTILALVIFVGYTLFIRITGHKGTPPQASPQVQGETQQAPETSPDISPVPSPQISPHPLASTTKSKIDIQVDSKLDNTAPTSEKIIYPGATNTDGNHYETGSRGDEVYSWYKTELDKRSFQIRNNVRTRANDKFKGILQGVSGSISIKITIEQDNASAKTLITLE